MYRSRYRWVSLADVAVVDEMLTQICRRRLLLHQQQQQHQQRRTDLDEKC